MINQEINLYQERFHEKQIPLSTMQSIVLAGVAAAVLLVSSYFYMDRRSEQQALQQQYLQQKETASQRLEALQGRLQQLLADTSIDDQMQQVNREIRVRKRMLDFVDNNQFGSGEGFAVNLETLASFKEKDLWLTEIAIEDGYTKLSGSALRADSVPQYFGQFRDRALFEGQEFDIFELGREQQRDWKVDFVIASRRQADE